MVGKFYVVDELHHTTACPMKSLLPLLLLFLLPGCAQPEPDTRPNIIIIMADDMGYSDIGSYGGEVSTPTLDAMAAEGIRFTQFYNMARCCPTRASLLTGLYPHQAGVGHMDYDAGLPGYQGDLSQQSVTIAQVVKEAGYSTYMSGKWHVSKHIGHWTGQDSLTSKDNWPMQKGFDAFFGTILGAGSFFDPITLTSGNTPITELPEDFYYTDAINDTAVTYIKNHTDDNPFFMYVAHTAPHWPLHALDEDIEKYAGRYDAGWDALRNERVARMKALGLVDPEWDLTERDPRVPAWEDLNEQYRAWYSRAMEVYAAQIDRMDQGIGRIMNALEESGQNENTLVLFLADNGGCAEVLSGRWLGPFLTSETRDGQPVTLGNEHKDVMPGPENTYMSYGIGWANASNTPFRLYKHWVHEGGIATPFIVHWPAQIKAGGNLVHAPGHVIDLMATAVDVAKATYPSDKAPMAGKSLIPALQNQTIERDMIFWEHEGNRAVRQGKWKLVARHNQPWELYDMEADRTELYNLAPQRPEKVDELVVAYERWAEANLVEPWPIR